MTTENKEPAMTPAQAVEILTEVIRKDQANNERVTNMIERVVTVLGKLVENLIALEALVIDNKRQTDALKTKIDLGLVQLNYIRNKREKAIKEKAPAKKSRSKKPLTRTKE